MPDKTIRKLTTLLEKGYLNEEDMTLLQQVVERFPLAIPEKLSALIDQADAEDPIKLQYVPSIQELEISEAERADPIGDHVHEVVKGLIHRYEDRCLFMPVQVCAVYCRFCFRREEVGFASNTLTQPERERAFAYIEAHPEIREVILTGGDPLILKPCVLQEMLQRLSEIPHVEVLRIHTRIPMADPSRITDDMLAALTLKKALFIAIHANHAKEFSEEVILALEKLVKHGIPLISQTTLLKGINDHIDALSDLMRMLVKHRIKPYYLHHADLAKGTSHFRTTIAEGEALMRALRGRFSGLCQPTYVLDIPGGFGKVPIGPQYLSCDHEGSITVQDYQGHQHVYETLL